MNRSADPTFEELKGVKKEIQKFVNEICKPTSEHTKNYYISICKKIVFLKYLIRQMPSDYKYRAFLSDLIYLLNSIKCGEERYYYLNVRSLIEQSMRIIAGVEDTETITNFELMQKIVSVKKSINHVRSVNTDIIQDQYSNACLYVHGSSFAQMELAEYYINTFEKDKVIENLETKLNQLLILLKSIFSLVIICKSALVDAAFHRRKSILRYLANDDDLINYVIEESK